MSDCTEQRKLIDSYKEYEGELLDMFSERKDMWNGHPGQVNAAKHGIELGSPDLWYILLAPNRDWLEAREFKRDDNHKM